MKSKILLLAISSLIFIQCASQNKTNDSKMPTTSSETVNSTYPTEKPENGTVRLVEKQNIFSEENKLNITFVKTIEDSRCPMNARCVTAGFATVEVEVMSLHSRPRKFTVSTQDNKNSFVFQGKKFTLTHIYPSNSTQIGFEKLKGKYVIDLKIE
ncbi:hypothetical protein GCM10010992_25190 [Cloacibacterium rupense]|uniref:Lipoprotein n=1 Tax=Cloacibacterium rupense TaxID=517423 RepID=A0ABQ2NL66_9FLAO|nr:hypothetical protein [Cloacibacterium rupense]GGP06144.1 hypothetical protein GCM10010992_25190 [Cloacibacterium rupense]